MAGSWMQLFVSSEVAVPKQVSALPAPEELKNIHHSVSLPRGGFQ